MSWDNIMAVVLLVGIVTGCSTVSIIVSGPRLNDELTPQPVMLVPSTPVDTPSQWISAIWSASRVDPSAISVDSHHPVPLDHTPDAQRLRSSCPRDRQVVKDHELKHQIERRMARSVFVDADYVVVCVHRDIVLLRGWVKNERERQDALAQARAGGAKEIVNDLQLLYRQRELISSPWYWLNPASVRYAPVVGESGTPY